MAANREALNKQLQQVVNSLKEQGNQFEIVHSLKEANSPFFLAEILPLFCQDVQTTLRDLSRTLEKEHVNYYDMEELYFKLRGCTSRCGLALNGVRNEYKTLRNSLDRIVELERRIVSHQG